VSSSPKNGAFLYALFGAIRLPNISRRESCYATRIDNSKNYIPRDLRNRRSMPTTLLGSTTLLFRDGECLAGNIIELFSPRVAGYLSPINPTCVDEKQEAVCTVFD
jgi:hypothetical protein